MTRKLVVHVGTHKTGSTSIQHMLDRLHAPLEQCGVHVAVTGRWQGHHGHLVSDLMYWRHNPCPRAWSDLADELTRQRGPRFVISAEHFTSPWAGRSAAARVAALVRECDLDVEVVGYIRPQHERLEASYAQQVKTGLQTLTFEAVLKDSPNDPRLDYNAVFEPWRSRFGERVSIYPLEPDRIPEGLLSHFLNLLGAGELTGEAARLPRMNRRVGARQLEALRLTSAALSNRMVDNPAKMRILAPLRERLPALLPGDAPFAGLSPAQVAALTERYAESNACFAREYGIDTRGVLFREAGETAAGRPNCATWHDFSNVEREGVRRLCREAAGVDLPGDAGPGPRRERLNAWEFIRWMEPRAVSVRAQDWRSVVLPSMAELALRRSVSVVVSGPGTREGLSRTLAALERQDYPRHLVEVIVVDTSLSGPEANGSSCQNVRAVRHDNADAAQARNAGAHAAVHDVLFFLDVGLVPETCWLAAHARWHHAVSDVVTVGERTVATAGRVDGDTVRDWRGSLATLFADRSDAPAGRDQDSTSGADDAIRLARNPFGIARHYFDLLGGFDGSLADRTDQDVEFASRAYTYGALLAPIREAPCFDPGPAPQGQAPGGRGPAQMPTRRSRGPRFAITIKAGGKTARAAFETAARLLTDAGPEWVVLLDVGVHERDTEPVQHGLGSDSRIRVGSADDARDRFPAIQLHVEVPAGARVPADLIHELESALGDAVGATLVLADGARVSMTRAWALHRARRTGRSVTHFGKVVTIETRKRLPAHRPRLSTLWRGWARS